MSSSALQIFAGPRARARLLEGGLRPADIQVVPAAAGGPKGLVLNKLDQFLFGDWLPQSGRPVHLLGASIGAWRMATACMTRSAAEIRHEFDRLAEEYAEQRYDEPDAPAGDKYRMPAAATVTRGFSAKLDEVFAGHEAAVLSHPQYRLHVFTSRGRHVLLAREGRLRTPVGYLGAFGANVVSRRMLGGWLERVVFSDPRARLPLPLNDFRSRQVDLSEENLRPSVLASCSIPFWLQAVHDIPGAPRGAYWDGGITDYHLHLNYAAMSEGLVLYPHFQRQVVPGWLDKLFKGRHRASSFLDNLVVLAPHPDWIARLPRAKLPDREDFKHYGQDVAARAKAWLQAVREGERLRDEFAAACQRQSLQAEPL